jgi:proteic killer suppression protein
VTIVIIGFKTSKLQKVFNSDRELLKEYGKDQSNKIKLRMAVLKSANNLSEIRSEPPERMHPLTGQRQGQFSVDVKQPYRLIFEPTIKPVPLKEDGGIDISKITEIKILEVEDDH